MGSRRRGRFCLRGVPESGNWSWILTRWGNFEEYMRKSVISLYDVTRDNLDDEVEDPTFAYTLSLMIYY